MIMRDLKKFKKVKHEEWDSKATEMADMGDYETTLPLKGHADATGFVENEGDDCSERSNRTTITEGRVPSDNQSDSDKDQIDSFKSNEPQKNSQGMLAQSYQADTQPSSIMGHS
mmetsp:Transcript_16550/g.28142  ORF Transcript_16550/g.28142 Transcript_16550/m.28142 type:complete len:114 (+) Transcript_16550:20-361(+)